MWFGAGDNRKPNSTTITTYPHTKEVTNYAKDSTIDIGPDRWGNLVVYVNGEDVVIMPKPFAVDADGKRFEMDFELDKKARTITVAGDLSGAKYPVTVDPTERVSNGGFETGNTNGWSGPYSVASGGAYQGNYYLDVVGSGGYTTLSQTIDYTGISSVSNAAAIPVVNVYDVPMSDIAITGWHWLVNAPGQYVQNWTYRSTTPGLTGTSTIKVWTYSNTHGHVDSISATVPDAPVADFYGTPTSGYAPLTVSFTDTSSNSPTSWEWDFDNDGTVDSYDQNPQHTYNEIGGYDVKLTVSNGGGSDTKTKPGYVTVTASTQATNIQGINESQTSFTSIIDVAAIEQNSLSYNPTSYYYTEGNLRQIIQPRLSTDAIFFSHTHGLPGLIEVNEDDSEYYFAKGDASGYNFDDISSYTKMKLAVFLGCHTGETDPTTQGNFVNVIANKGGGCAIGWTDAIVDYGVHAYGPVFWNEIGNGLPILSAHYNAVEAARADSICQQLEPEIEACRMGQIYSAGNNNQCTLPISSVFYKQMTYDTGNQVQQSTGNGAKVSGKLIDQISTVIKNFEGNPVLTVVPIDVRRNSYADLYQYDSENTTYWVNNVTHRVQSMSKHDRGSNSLDEIITLDQGFLIAETYAKDKFPDIWETSNKKGIKLVREEIFNGGTFREQRFSWQEILLYPDEHSLIDSDIFGLNSVSVSVSPYSGEVISYNERYHLLDMGLDLTPSLSKEQAGEIANIFFQKIGFTNTELMQKKCYGLQVALDNKNYQHLVWKFELMQKDEKGFDEGGWIGIDAHDGEIVWYALVG